MEALIRSYYTKIPLLMPRLDNVCNESLGDVEEKFLLEYQVGNVSHRKVLRV